MKTDRALAAFEIKNTNGQTLRALVKGCTLIDHPGPRLAAFAATLDPAMLAALGLAGARIRGAVQ